MRDQVPRTGSAPITLLSKPRRISRSVTGRMTNMRATGPHIQLTTRMQTRRSTHTADRLVGYGGSSADSTYTVTGPGFDPQEPARYDPIQGYGDSSSYRNPYEANPYQPSFGGVSPYGAAPTQIPTPHPQAALALVLGILGTVLGLGCIVGGLVGSAESSSAAGSRTRSMRSRDATAAAPRQSPVLLRALSAYRSRFWQRYSSCSRSLPELLTQLLTDTSIREL